MEYITEIERLKREQDAIVLAHYYTPSEVQDIADFIGDSLALSQMAAQTNAKTIVFAGVNFMAETAKILSPEKRVLIPDTDAGCSLAESCQVIDFKRFIDKHPDHIVVSYVNTSVGIKALTDICCTSSNAVKIIESIARDQPIIFAPDRNLGDYLKRVTKRDNMVIWDGACHVHEKFSLSKILELKKENPDAKIIAHPECKAPVLMISDFIGSTSALLKYISDDNSQCYIVATESGILYQMERAEPTKRFIPAPPSSADSSCACSDCEYMKMVTVEKIYHSLRDGTTEVVIEEELRVRALRSIERMLELS